MLSTNQLSQPINTFKSPVGTSKSSVGTNLEVYEQEIERLEARVRVIREYLAKAYGHSMQTSSASVTVIRERAS
jgi:hypothetical protein